MTINSNAIFEACPCPKIKCKRHGKCEECRSHHGRRGPFCERVKK